MCSDLLKGGDGFFLWQNAVTPAVRVGHRRIVAAFLLSVTSSFVIGLLKVALGFILTLGGVTLYS
jgi:sulfur transfer complex TusBCD TusB component (DsrH family)